jgi:hypothetical protein
MIKVVSLILHSSFRAGVLAALFYVTTANADDATATATLSSGTTSPGQPVELQIQVSGARQVEVPQQISVDGLSIVHTGQSTQFQMNNFNITTSATHTYTVTPQRAGKFVIPGVSLDIGGKKLTTNSVTLEVSGSGVAGGGASGGASSGGSTAQPGAPDEVNGKLAFCELIVPKQSAYVGEAIPVELRVYVDDRVSWRPEQPPTLAGEGLTSRKFTEPRQDKVSKDGRTFNLVTYKTSITPAKAGNLSAGPAQLQCIMQLPRPRPALPRGFDDFFNDPFGAFAVPQHVLLKSDPTPIEAKPLPTVDQPKTFEGAVGQFSLATKVNAQKVHLGDPVTMTLKVTGRGNFDRVSAPRMIEESGWRSYPPSSDFKEDDVVGISGTKTFEMVLIPDEKKTQLPAVQFSYFDPIAKKYVTLTSDITPIVVEGQNPPVVAQAPAPGSHVTATPEATANSSDIHYIRADVARWGKSFDPIYYRRVFWVAQVAPALALLGFIGVQWRRVRMQDENATRLASLRRERGELMKVLKRSDACAQEFFDAAARCIGIDTALVTGGSTTGVHAAEACASRALDAETARQIAAIFATVDELRYAGRSIRDEPMSPGKRVEVLDTIQKFEASHA